MGDGQASVRRPGSTLGPLLLPGEGSQPADAPPFLSEQPHRMLALDNTAEATWWASHQAASLMTA